jgi:hypothetical protein
MIGKNVRIVYEQEHGKASKEEEKGDMEQRWQHFDGPGNVQLLDPVPEKRTNTCSLVGAVAWVGDP